MTAKKVYKKKKLDKMDESSFGVEKAYFQIKNVAVLSIFFFKKIDECGTIKRVTIKKQEKPLKCIQKEKTTTDH